MLFIIELGAVMLCNFADCVTVLSFVMPSVVLCRVSLCWVLCYAVCHCTWLSNARCSFAECLVLSVVMLDVVMPGVVLCWVLLCWVLCYAFYRWVRCCNAECNFADCVTVLSFVMQSVVLCRVSLCWVLCYAVYRCAWYCYAVCSNAECLDAECLCTVWKLWSKVILLGVLYNLTALVMNRLNRWIKTNWINVTKLFPCPFLYPGAICRIWTLNLWLLRWVF
jgi:hypothetical protein